MKYLLTSAGAKNPKILNALLELLGKPISQCTALCIPTAMHAQTGGNVRAWEFVTGHSQQPMCELGWKSVGLLELTALEYLQKDRWLPSVQAVDALIVSGGDPLFLSYWMRRSGFADVLPTLKNTVYFGMSAGSMVMAPNIGQDFVNWTPPEGGDQTIGMVNFAIFPHLDHPNLPENTMADASRWAANMLVPCYAIDDDTALKVYDENIEVITEGHWKLFNHIKDG